jgi:hypothetical protein
MFRKMVVPHAVNHLCESGVLAGAVDDLLASLESPAEGDVLVCRSEPRGDVVIDL